MKAWHDALRAVLQDGERTPTRTGTHATSIFGHMLQVNNTATYPAVTTKRLAFKQVKAEMASFLEGASLLSEFHRNGCAIWDKNAEAWSGSKGYLGRVYGVQWLEWAGPTGPVDQMKALYESIRKDPHGRRHIVTAWNPGELDMMCLPPCPFAFQVSVRHGGMLDMAVYQRSCDAFLGLPFDIAGYALLQRLIAKSTGYTSGRLTFLIGDLHVYDNHLDQAATVLERMPKPPPTITIGGRSSMFKLAPEDAQMHGYESWPTVEAALNV